MSEEERKIMGKITLNASTEEIVYNLPLILYSKFYKEAINIVLNRSDAKEIFKRCFEILFINAFGETNNYFFDVILDDKNAHIFDSIIRDNIRLILRNLSKQEEMARTWDFYKYKDLMCQEIGSVIENNIFFASDLLDMIKSDEFYLELLKPKYDILNKLLESIEIQKQRRHIDYKNFLFFFNLLGYMDEKYLKEHENEVEELINISKSKLDPEVLCNDISNDSEIILNNFSKAARLNESINNNLEDSLDFIVCVFTGHSVITLFREGIYDFYFELIREILTDEKVELKDVKYHSGFNSRVAIIGNKVLKDGKKDTTNIPYHKRILQPSLRISIPHSKNFLGKNLTAIFGVLVPKDDFSCVEVYEKVETDNISEDNVYGVFKELIEDDIIWSDPNCENLGRLLKSNVPYIKEAYIKDSEAYKKGLEYDEKYYIDDETVNMTRTSKKEILQEGELVIIDLDFLFKSNTPNLKEFLQNKIRNDEIIDADEVCKMLQIDAAKTFDQMFYRYVDELRQKINIK